MADDFGCSDHSNYAGGHHVHPDAGRKEGYTPLPEHRRGVGHPAKHSKGKLPSQLNPDHGTHRGAGRQR